MRLSKNDKEVIARWKQIPLSCNETDLTAYLIEPILSAVGIEFPFKKNGINIGISSARKPDIAVYNDLKKPPVFVMENKKRVPQLAQASDEEFTELCRSHVLYREAVGYELEKTNNGIRQYLDVNNVHKDGLATYGIVFNGDFFQIWRRRDGLVLLFTDLQRVNEKTLPLIIRQIKYCWQSKNPALVATVWNQKGGVAKTTSVLNLGATLAIEGKRVLLVDLDPQTDLTRGVGLDPEQGSDYLYSCIDKLALEEVDVAKQILSESIKRKIFKTSDRKSYRLDILQRTQIGNERGRIEKGLSSPEPTSHDRPRRIYPK